MTSISWLVMINGSQPKIIAKRRPTVFNSTRKQTETQIQRLRSHFFSEGGITVRRYSNIRFYDQDSGGDSRSFPWQSFFTCCHFKCLHFSGSQWGSFLSRNGFEGTVRFDCSRKTTVFTRHGRVLPSQRSPTKRAHISCGSRNRQ